MEINGEYHEQRWMGYSVGKWLDDMTLKVQTVGTMPDEVLSAIGAGGMCSTGEGGWGSRYIVKKSD